MTDKIDGEQKRLEALWYQNNIDIQHLNNRAATENIDNQNMSMAVNMGSYRELLILANETIRRKLDVQESE